MNADFIDPIIFSLGPLQVRWYGMMYVIGFVLAGFLFKKLSRDGFFQVPEKESDNLVTYALVGIFLGARIFYVFVYNWDYYSNHLDEILSVWKGGLSYHGAIIGLILSNIVFARRYKIPSLQVTDACCLAGSQGVFFGRLGNFINGELYGRVTDVPWAFTFAQGGPYPRHPSQLYEALTEGLLIFIILWSVKRKIKNYGMITGIYFILYGVGRFIMEFFREADAQLGYYFGNTTTMGQILCFIMIIFGISLVVYSSKKKLLVSTTPIKAA